MKDTVYRLGDYKITESDAGILHWEAHYGIGMLREGMCYLKGDILFIEPAENQKEGFLKLEFLESFRKAASWSKTRYLCANTGIFNCLDGKKVIRDEMLQWRLEKQREKSPDGISPNFYGSDTEEQARDQSFRLQKYMIIKMQGGDIIWRLHAGANITKSGSCFLLEDIIFLSPSSNRLKIHTRQQFRDDLQRLSEWTQTRYYTKGCCLQESEIVNRVKEEKKSWTGLLKSKKDKAGHNVIESGTKSSGEVDKRLKSYSGESKGVNVQYSSHIKIKKNLTVILFVLIALLTISITFLFVNRREHSERYHYKSDEYSHNTHRKH